MQNETGFSLVEMMITLAISAIIIGAAFGSYTIIQRNFEWQKDMKYISQSARSVVEMITKDIRNAGFRFESSAAITDPVKIYDAGDAKDRIEIVYDETESPYKRVKIEYRLQQYSNDNSRFRLFKKKTNMTSGAIEYDSPVADYVESIQFLPSRGECISGDEVYGCGTMKWINPISVRTFSNSSYRECGNGDLMIDGDLSTYWRCGSTGAKAEFMFPNKFRLTKIKVDLFPDLEGGTYTSSPSIWTMTYPFGQEHAFYQEFNIYLDGSVCTWSTTCTPNPIMHSGNLWATTITDGGLATYCMDECEFTMPQNTAVPSGFNVQQSVINKLELHVFSALHAQYDSNGNIIGQTNTNYKEVNEISFYGEEYGSVVNPQEIEVGLLIRSPNEHGNVDRSFDETIGDYSFSADDKYLRDTYVTSATMRNIYYQSQ